jgi:hypothetical protein
MANVEHESADPPCADAALPTIGEADFIQLRCDMAYVEHESADPPSCVDAALPAMGEADLVWTSEKRDCGEHDRWKGALNSARAS